ncbi:MAG: hypothetical protein RJB24_561 [Candidatus Parcubacteria bacterium]|jgi:FkbM family methyltransferase
MLKKIAEKIIPHYIRKNIFSAKSWLYYYIHKKSFPNIIIRPKTSDIFMFRQVFIRKDYLFPELPKNFNNSLRIIDCGANVGYASIWLAKEYPNSSIVAIEPEEYNYQTLLQNINSFPQITPLQNGVWIKKSPLKIIDKGFGESGFMIEEVASKQEADVEGISISDIMNMKKWDQIDIIKMDIEGTEKIILQNPIPWMKKCKLLIIELHEEMMPGVTELFHKKFPENRYNIRFQGENFIISHK